MHFVKAAYVIIEACDRVIDSKLKSALCKETVTPLIDSSHSQACFIRIKSIQKGLSKKQVTRKDETLAKNVPAESEWLVGDDLNKRINTIKNLNIALTANICPYYQYGKYQGSKTGSNQQHYS